MFRLEPGDIRRGIAVVAAGFTTIISAIALGGSSFSNAEESNKPVEANGCSTGRSISRSALACTPTWRLFDNFEPTDLDSDLDVLISPAFQTDHPFMDDDRTNAFVRSLDSDTSNEFHLPWNDYQLIYNYFYAEDSTAYYNSSPPHMHFDILHIPPIPPNETNHVDLYLSEMGGGHMPSIYTDPQEDGDLTACDEFNENSIDCGPGDSRFSWTLDGQILILPDSLWYLSGGLTNVTACHEFQHVCFDARNWQSNPSGFPNEMLSKAAEYLAGATLRDSSPLLNPAYDRPLVGPSQLQGYYLVYDHWYLWSIYLLQRFAADSTRIEDDLLYKWIRTTNESGVKEISMHTLARALEAHEYDEIPGTGAQRLRSVFHDYAIAKWINNPSPGLGNGHLGFSRGIVPSVIPGFFDNRFNPCKKSAEEVPPRYVVGPERIGSDSLIQFGSVRVTADSCGIQLSGGRDTCAVWLYGTDYLQFVADSSFETTAGNDTLNVRVFWHPVDYPGGGSGNSLRVSAIVYNVGGDSLYGKGQYVTSITDAFIDSIAGRTDIAVPSFGKQAKAVVVSIDLGEVSPPNLGGNPRRLYYGYMYGVNNPIPTGVSATESETPRMALASANPAYARTRVRFSVARTSSVALRVFDVKGRLVRTLIDGRIESGAHTIDWDGRDMSGRRVPSGIYWYRLSSMGQLVSRKLLFLN